MVHEVRDYILSEVAKGPRRSIASIAEKYFITEKTLTREFKKEFGISLKKFKVQERMKVAKAMMEKGIENSLIAAQLGYSNVFNFKREFNKHFHHK